MVTQKAFDLAGLISESHNNKNQSKGLIGTGLSSRFDDLLGIQFKMQELSGKQNQQSDILNQNIPGVADGLKNTRDTDYPVDSGYKYADTAVDSSYKKNEIKNTEDRVISNERESRVESPVRDADPEVRMIKEKSVSEMKNSDVSDEGEVEDTEVEELVESLRDLLNLLIDKGKKNGELQEIKTSLLKLRKSLLEAGKGKPGDGKVFEKLFSQMKDLMKLLDKKQGLLKRVSGKDELTSLKKLLNIFDRSIHDFSKVGDLKKKLTALNQEISRLVKIIAGDTGKNSSAQVRSDLDQLDIKNVSNRIVVLPERMMDNKGGDSSGNNDSNMSFQMFKNSNGVMRNMQSSVGTQNSLFKEQLQQVVQNARIFVQDSRNGTFSVRLNPESLGRLNVMLGLEQGVLNGRFLVESVDAKIALLDNMEAMKEMLNEAGVTVGEFQVDVRDGAEQFFSDTGDHEAALNTIPGDRASNDYELQTYHQHDGMIDMTI